ncbi:MAG: hypothetical protein QF805_06775, partial [Pirellulaceae bacterium]|nr:hypothetical protein [Pirellulaceae bacterium]
EETDIDAPVAITVSPRGELVVGQMGEVTVPNDGLLTFYGEDGKMLANFETGLSDVTDIAYSPKGMLYALDFSWVDATKGGLFRLVAKRDGNAQTVIAKEMEKLDKPSAMVFGKDGSLYITVFGTADGDKKGGKLLKVEIGL